MEEFSALKKQNAVKRSLSTAAEAAAGSLSPSLRGGEGQEEEESREGGQEQRKQGDRFITYWSEKGTDRPVKWVFFNDAYFQVSKRSGPEFGWHRQVTAVQCK